MDTKEGYLKFHCKLEKSGAVIPNNLFSEINKWRSQMYSLNLIGAYENGIGFGNISVRVPETNNFYISGSATGNFKKTGPEHYVLVTNYNFDHNSLNCQGTIPASSESLSHAAIYEADEEIMAVIHIHNMEMWENGLDKFPTSNPKCSFGTPEIAMDIAGLLKNEATREKGIIIMGGHTEGILFFGKNLEGAGNTTLKYYKKLTND
ncbi:MAG: class II aldolase/adducin family protein [Bacteroidales bacterium]|nr:class II aldolase/adducin family protein [Bacteroidales bacterium]